MTIPAYPLSFE